MWCKAGPKENFRHTKVIANHCLDIGRSRYQQIALGYRVQKVGFGNDMIRTARKTKKSLAWRSGAAVTELAITLPVLVLMLMATIECCCMIFVTQTLHIAAYEGTRVALVPKITPAQVDFAIRQILNDRRVQNATITIEPSNFSAAPIQSFIRVRVTAPANSNTLVSPLFFSNQTLRGECSMMKEY